MSTIINDTGDTRKNTENTRNDTDNMRNDTENTRLKFLEDLSGYKVHHDDVDPRGYTVKLNSGENIGEVEGLLADTSANLVRYVEVEIEDDVIKRYTSDRYTEEDRHALIPVGLVHLNSSSDTATLLGLTFDNLVDYPRFQKSKGYTTRYEVDTNDYLSDFHEYGNSYDRDRFSTNEYRNSDTLDDDFYTSDFYTKTPR